MRDSLQSWLEERNRFLAEGEPSAEIAAFFEDLRAPTGPGGGPDSTMTTAGSQPTASSSAPLHWHQPHPFRLPPLGDGVDGERQADVASCLERLSHDPEVAALVLFGSRARDAARPDSDLDLLLIRREPELDGAAVQRLWWQHLQQVWDLPLGLDLVVVGRAEADRLAGSRWHAIGYAAREGKVVYVAE